ncbi:MAG: hypothetical protein OXE59_05720 [Bacteroidetes bacterium]|nr:hypothetical protein [Bacteroidota bacterium]
MFPIEKQRWLVWHYTNKVIPSPKFWQRSHESILWKSNKQPNLEIEQIREPYTEGYKTSIGRTRTESRFGNSQHTIYQDNGGALPRDVFKFLLLQVNLLHERGGLCIMMLTEKSCLHQKSITTEIAK